ncbi:MAG: CHAT domain-containing protein [Pseudonocardiales bacterium]|nr:CHAT domain-containing protein [Pseudonocardiales bacterium]
MDKDYLVSVRLSRPGGPGTRAELRYDFGPDVPGSKRKPPPAPLDAAELQRLLTESDTHYYVEAPGTSPEQRRAQLKNMGSELFQLLDTPEGLLTGFLADYGGNWPVIVLGIGADTGLGHLPWELLRDANGYLIERPNPVVPIRVLPGRAIPDQPKARPLRVMFMAGAPEHGGRPLDYDAERTAINNAAEENTLLVKMGYEPSGRLDALQRTLARFDGNDAYDVLHLTGHCTDTPAGVRVVTVGCDDGPHLADAGELHRALTDCRPRMVFLSGCRSAASADLGVAVSLAEELATNLAQTTVVGWGRPIDDAAATNATKDFYRELMAGRSPARALAAAYQRLIKDDEPNWHCLRMFRHGGPPPSLVTSVRNMTGGEVFSARGGPGRPFGLDKVDDNDFLDRNPELTLLLKHCDPSQYSDRLGVVVHGVGKIGKTSLVSWTLDLVLDRMRDNVTWVPMVGGLDDELLWNAMQSQDDLAHHLDSTDRPEDLRPTLRRCLQQIARPVVFVLDNLDSTLRSDESEPRLMSEAAQTLAALIKAVKQSGKNHRLVITSRYVPAVTGIDQLAHVELRALSAQYLRLKINRMQWAGPIDPMRVELVLEMSQGNTGLLETLSATTRDNPDLPIDLLREKLHTERKDFVTEHLMVPALLDRQTEEDRELLRALTPLRLPVGPAVLARLANPALRTASMISSIDSGAAGKRAMRLAKWTLLERTDTPDGRMLFRVPDILEPRLGGADPVAESQCCAEALAAELGQFDDILDPRKPDVQALTELFRLATAGRAEDLIVRSARALARTAALQYRFRDAVELCQRAIEVVAHPLLFAELGNAHAELGNSAVARSYLAAARNGLDRLMAKDQARVLALVAFWASFDEPAAALGDFEQALRLARAAADTLTETDCSRLVATMHARNNNRQQAEEFFAKARELAQQLPDGEMLVALITMDRVMDVDLRAGSNESAREELSRLLRFYEETGLELYQAAVHIRLATTLRLMQSWVPAMKSAERARTLSSRLGWARGECEAVAEISQIQAWESTQPGADQAGLESRALATAAQARKLAEDVGWPVLRQHAVGNQAFVCRILGRHAEAAGWERQLEDTGPDRIGRLLSTAELCRRDAMKPEATAVARDARNQEARAAAREALILLLRFPNPDQEIRGHRVVADVGDEVGAPATEIESNLVRLHELCAERQPELLPLVELWLGRMQLREGGPDAATEHLQRSLAGYVEQGDQSSTGYLHEVISSVPGRPVKARIRDLATAAQLRLAGTEYVNAAVDLRELAVLLPPARRRTLLRAALVLAEAEGQDMLSATVLDDLAAVAGSDAERVELTQRAVAARRRGQPLTLLVGGELANLLHPDRGGFLLTEMAARRATLRETGIILPTVHTMDDTSLSGDSYHVYLWGERVTQGEFTPQGQRWSRPRRREAAQAVVEAVAQVVTAHPDRLDPPVPQPRTLNESERAVVAEARAELVALAPG